MQSSLLPCPFCEKGEQVFSVYGRVFVETCDQCLGRGSILCVEPMCPEDAVIEADGDALCLVHFAQRQREEAA